MQTDAKPHRRFTESIWGIIAAGLLAVLWIASMTMVDSNTYSITPYVAGLVLVVAAWALGIITGCKFVRMRWISWFSLAAGAYFLVRCHLSYSVVEAWGEAGIIFGCFVFYIAGIYAGQGERCGWIMGTITAALILNGISMWLTHSGQGLPWSLRPEYGVCGATARNTALFTYKNFAGFFMLVAGALPLCNLVCNPGFKLRNASMAVIGLIVAAMAFKMTGTRVAWALIPFLVVFIWLLRLLVCLAENKRPGILLVLTGIVFFIAGSIALYDFLFERTLINELMRIDTHLRTMAWELAAKVAPAGDWCGFGARAAQWEIVQTFNEWCTPNYIHNEYLQAWVDYGVVGISLMGGILLLHLVAGLRQLTAEHVSSARRGKAGMALTFLLAVSLYAICDFPWHQAALSAATAFSCGILASPYPARPLRWRELWRNWAPGSRPAPTRVRAQGIFARILLLVLGLALAGDMVQTCRHTAPAWVASWEYNDMTRHWAPASERVALLENVHATYPDSKLIDHYVLLPMPKGKGLDTLEGMLRKTLEANPRQVFTAIILADLLGREGRFEDAEKIFRKAYDGDGAPACRTNSWGFYYYFNLIRWGQKKMYEGDLPTALSMLEYGFSIGSHTPPNPDTTWRGGYKPWENGHTAKFRRSVRETAKMDLQMLKSKGIQPDDSWQEPMEEGGKPSLYRRWKPSRR